MTPEADLVVLRRAFAAQIMAAAETHDARVQAAFAQTPREAYLGAGPWPVLRFGGRYVTTPGDDPVYLYTDALVGIAPERGINNGQPSLHASLLARAGVVAGDHVVQVGAGVGYYSALIACLCGPSGRVTAIEFEPDLAARATANLAHLPQIRVIRGDGTLALFNPADVIYVNAGVTRPADAWLDGLREGGRLVFMLTTDRGNSGEVADARPDGACFLVTRHGADFHARWLSAVRFYACQSMRDPESERALVAALAQGAPSGVTRLYRSDAIPHERCWLKAPGWCLAYD